MKELTLNDFAEGVKKIIGAEITNVAPLGASSDDIILSGTRRNVEGQRESLVSLRKYCSEAELLITDKKGRFLTYQKYGIVLGVEYISRKFYAAWQELSGLIDTEVDGENEVVFSNEVKFTGGFKILQLAHSAMEKR
jgi:hypothetical protein